jgi:hypothetical protein
MAQHHEFQLDAVYAAVMPIAVKADIDLRASSVILALLEAPPATLKHIMVDVMRMATDNLGTLLRCELMAAMSCALHRMRDDKVGRSSMLIAMRHTLEGRRGWQAPAREAGLGGALMALVGRGADAHDVDAAFSILRLMVTHQSFGELLVLHDIGLSRSVVGHISCRRSTICLLAEMTRLNNTCRYIHRDAVRRSIVVERLLACIDAGAKTDPLRYTAAAECMTRLNDNDPPRMNEALGGARESLRALIIRQLVSCTDGDLSETVVMLGIVRSLLGRGTTTFAMQEKELRLPTSVERDPIAVEWSMFLGAGVLRALAVALDRVCSRGDMRAAMACIDQLAQTTPLSVSLASDVAGAVTRKLRFTRDPVTARAMLEVVAIVAMAIAPHRPEQFAPDVGNIMARLMHFPDFRLACAGQRLYYHAAPAEGGDCCMCLDSMTGTGASKTCCGHVFHTTCLAKWFATKQYKSCPICRSEGITMTIDLVR